MIIFFFLSFSPSNKIFSSLRRNSISVIFLLLVSYGLYWTCKVPGRHQPYIDILRKNGLNFCSWIGLGILSSVGLGFGLHTFLLYLVSFVFPFFWKAFFIKNLTDYLSIYLSCIFSLLLWRSFYSSSEWAACQCEKKSVKL